jgi:hypothetical protein
MTGPWLFHEVNASSELKFAAALSRLVTEGKIIYRPHRAMYYISEVDNEY